MESFSEKLVRGMRKPFEDPKLAALVLVAAIVLALIKAREEERG